jgi:hypothetical protein
MEYRNESFGFAKARYFVTKWATDSFSMLTAAMHMWRHQPRINPRAVPGKRENSAILTSRDDVTSREVYLNAGFAWYYQNCQKLGAKFTITRYCRSMIKFHLLGTTVCAELVPAKPHHDWFVLRLFWGKWEASSTRRDLQVIIVNILIPSSLHDPSNQLSGFLRRSYKNSWQKYFRLRSSIVSLC